MGYVTGSEGLEAGAVILGVESNPSTQRRPVGPTAAGLLTAVAVTG